MGRINLLTFEVANLIAAGEVVERPSSVLKELVENSIDAGATAVTCEIRNGGVSLIRVTDNGHGIEKEDLPIALKRHATSKIKDKEDLDGIMTLGFRGEALAAISSVSEMTIITKTKTADTAYMLTAEAGEVVDISEVSAQDGTTVVVKDLFYNVPARRKFLKKDVTEAMNVSALVEKVALSRPDISFQLIINGEERFKTFGDGLHGAISAIYGRDFASKLLKAEGSANGIKVSGFVGRSDNVRKNRNLLNVFINSRYVKSLTAQSAIEKAFTSYIAPECFPVSFIYLEINPSLVDVNVHPAKLEVKFSDERAVFEAVYYTVKCAVENAVYRPELEIAKEKKNPLNRFLPLGENNRGEQLSFASDTAEVKKESKSSFASDINRGSLPTYATREKERDKAQYDRPLKVSQPPRAQTGETLTPSSSLELLKKYRESVQREEEAKALEKTEEKIIEAPPEFKLIGEAFDCYVFVEYNGELLVIDKHAAHERIIFEDLKRGRSRDGRIGSQRLMLPLTVMLSPDELSCAEEFKAEIINLGFDYNLNERAVDILAIPDAVSLSDAENLFVKMCQELAEGKGTPQNTEQLRRERALYQIACKAAIKGGRKYDRAILDWLVGRLLSLPDITVCPHGRPVAFKLTKSELDRRFDRLK